jgi:hypothetical protein
MLKSIDRLYEIEREAKEAAAEAASVHTVLRLESYSVSSSAKSNEVPNFFPIYRSRVRTRQSPFALWRKQVTRTQPLLCSYLSAERDNFAY